MFFRSHLELFATDNQKIHFLLEAEAFLLEEELHAAAIAAEDVVSEELPPEKRPKYITNYIGSKQKLTDWIWRNTPEDVKSVFDAFSGSVVISCQLGETRSEVLIHMVFQLVILGYFGNA